MELDRFLFGRCIEKFAHCRQPTLPLWSGFRGCDGQTGGLSQVDVLMGDDHFFARLVPTAVFVQAGMGANGADDAIGCCGDRFGLLDDATESVLSSGRAAAEKPKGVGMAVNRQAAKLEVPSDVGRAPPVKEGLIDVGATGMAADGAVGFMVVEAYVA